MASLTRWTWVWVNSGSWWWTGRPGVLWFMGSQRVGHDWVTELTKSLLSMLPNFLVDYGERNRLICLGEIRALSLKNASWYIISFLAHYIETLLSSNVCIYVWLNTQINKVTKSLDWVIISPEVMTFPLTFSYYVVHSMVGLGVSIKVAFF